MVKKLPEEAKKTILLVEDEEDMRLVYAEVLREVRGDDPLRHQLFCHRARQGEAAHAAGNVRSPRRIRMLDVFVVVRHRLILRPRHSTPSDAAHARIFTAGHALAFIALICNLVH